MVGRVYERRKNIHGQKEMRGVTRRRARERAMESTLLVGYRVDRVGSC